MNNFIVTMALSQEQLRQLSNWMQLENEDGDTIYHHVAALKTHFDNGTLLVIEANNQAVGFVTWSAWKRVAYIENLAVSVAWRMKGLGKSLMELLLANLKELGIFVIYLLCAPAESEKFWEGLRFQKMSPIQGYSDRDKTYMFRILIEQEIEVAENSEQILIRDFGNTIKITRQIRFKQGSRKLASPLIVPVQGDWLIERPQFANKYLAEKIKHFQLGEAYDAPFFILTEL